MLLDVMTHDTLTYHPKEHSPMSDPYFMDDTEELVICMDCGKRGMTLDQFREHHCVMLLDVMTHDTLTYHPKEHSPMSEKQILVSSVLDPEWNSRLWTESAEEKRETEALAESMKADGQLQSIEVEETTPGTHLLVFGSRRLRAAKLLNWETIRATVNPPTDDATRVVRNILENVKRKDLSQYEQARACVKLREVGMKGEEIGARLGFSKQKVSNLAVSFTQLPPVILNEWREEHPAATVDYLRELASVGKEEKDPDKRAALQVEAWEERKELQAEAEDIIDPPPAAEQCKGKVSGKRCTLDAGHEGEHKPPRETPDPPFRVPAQRFYDLAKAVQKSKVAGGKLIMECMKFLVGQSDGVKGIIEPTPKAAE